MTQSEPSTVDTIADVIAAGDYAESLFAIRDRLAAEADDVRWDQHKRECVCVCGMGDGRTLVAVLARLHVVLDAIEALPEAKEESRLDRISAGVSDIADARKHRRLAVADGS